MVGQGEYSLGFQTQVFHQQNSFQNSKKGGIKKRPLHFLPEADPWGQLAHTGCENEWNNTRALAVPGTGSPGPLVAN